MKWKNRLTNYNFWISIVSAGLLILRAFDIKMDVANINEIVTAVLGVLVMIGIVNDPTHSVKSERAKEDKTTQTTTEEPASDAESSIPSAEQNEDDIGVDENALQMLINKISTDIQQKLTEMNTTVDASFNFQKGNTSVAPSETIADEVQGTNLDDFQEAETNIETPAEETKTQAETTASADETADIITDFATRPSEIEAAEVVPNETREILTENANAEVENLSAPVQENLRSMQDLIANQATIVGQEGIVEIEPTQLEFISAEPQIDVDPALQTDEQNIKPTCFNIVN